MTSTQFLRLPHLALFTALLLGPMALGCGGGASGQRLQTACRYLDGFTYHAGSGKCCKGNPANGHCISCGAGDTNCKCDCCSK